MYKILKKYRKFSLFLGRKFIFLLSDIEMDNFSDHFLCDLGKGKTRGKTVIKNRKVFVNYSIQYH